MTLSSQMTLLKAFVHISTYFVNNHLPRNSLVMEKIYPLDLHLNGKPMSHQQLVSTVMAMEPAAANQAVTQLLQVSRGKLQMLLLGCLSTLCVSVLLTKEFIRGTMPFANSARGTACELHKYFHTLLQLLC